VQTRIASSVRCLKSPGGTRPQISVVLNASEGGGGEAALQVVTVYETMEISGPLTRLSPALFPSLPLL